MKAALSISVLSLLMGGVWSLPLRAQTALVPDQPVLNTLTDTPQTYTLSLDSNTPFVLEISGFDAYAYLTSDGQPVTPLNSETRDQNGMPLTRLAYTTLPENARLIVEGRGPYTLRLNDKATIGSTIAVLRDGDVIEDELFADEPHRYLLDADENSLFTLSIGTKQRSFYARVVNGRGEIITPLLSLADAEGFRELIALRGPAPYTLYLFGVNDYRLIWTEGDTITTAQGTLTENASFDAPSGSGRFTLKTDAPFISVLLDEFEAQTLLFDSGGMLVPFDSRFYDSATRQRIVVYRLNGQAPYILMVQSLNTYTITLQSGDLSQVDLGVLAVNSTAADATAPGRTPVYTLESAVEDELILTLFYDATTLRTYPPFTIVSSDGQTTQPNRLWGGAGQIQAFFTLAGQPPYRLALAVSGTFSLSLVQRQVAGVMVTLTTIDTNLRSGPTLNAPALRQGQPGETYTAIGRSADDAWILLLTPDDSALWVYRQLVTNAPGTTLANLPIIQAASVGMQTEATPEAAPVMPSPTATAPTISASPAATVTSALPFITVTPAKIVCRIASQGGVNVRSVPSTTGAIAGSLGDGQTAAVIGQATDETGRIWWQISDLSWVRSDVVAENGDCTAAPIVKNPQ